MTSAGATSRLVGQVLEIEFPSFAPRITFNSRRKLTVEILSGENAGFTDTVDYEAIAIRDGLMPDDTVLAGAYRHHGCACTRSWGE
jgi:hypothetical protein